VNKSDGAKMGCYPNIYSKQKLPNGDKMDKNDLENFKKLLETIKKDINSDVEQTLAEMHKQPDNVPDPNDRATIESDRNFELRLCDRERKLITKVNEALARIEEGIYGICGECGEKISSQRLEARPMAELCIYCKTSQEHLEKEQGRV
jgi:DnaK suppressor protein